MKNTEHINSRDSYTQSPWQVADVESISKADTDFPPTYDVIIVGAGITGITTALMLQKAGKQCVVIEAGTVGYGTTGGTTAHLNTFFDATYAAIETDFGEEAAKLTASSGKESFAMIKDFIDLYHIECDFEYKGAYLFSETEKETKQLTELLEATRKAGINVIEYQDNGVPVPFQKAIHFIDQGQFHPLKYTYALTSEFVKLGGVILENSFVEETKSENYGHIAKIGNQSLVAKSLVWATHVPPGITPFSFSCAPYRSYVLGIKLKNDAYPTGLSYDMQEPYHYFRTHEIKGQKYLIVGGEDHKTGHEDPKRAFENLEAYANKYYRVESVSYRWSSQYYVPVDGLPYIGLLTGSDNTYVATGFNGNGMIFGTLSAKIISDQILDVENKYADLYSPLRIKPIAGFSEFIKENADFVWHFVADRFGAEELESLKDLQREKGIIVELQGEKVAIYKDENGKVTALSPICTHAGCTLAFNDAEKSWDCPCHGGRFDINGKVLTGPPTKNLVQIQIE
ncbi:FAD-dependent oxidoreductase [Pedobacter sp. JCM 36344]|uniref:FAD-dependent oxidoreductase n=1 Tax=Pedobacter sp. JCM 36344 TaxID=3374280 RepID=UPI00397C125A